MTSERLVLFYLVWRRILILKVLLSHKNPVSGRESGYTEGKGRNYPPEGFIPLPALLRVCISNPVPFGRSLSVALCLANTHPPTEVA